MLVLLFVGVASLVNILSLSPHSKVQPLDADQSREFIRDESVYQAAADKLLAKSILNRNKLTIDSNGLSRDLERQFPELASVSMTVPLFAHRPLVYIQPAQPVVIISGTSGSYALDKTGKAIEPTAALSSSVQARLPKITDQSGLELRKNQQALSSDDIEFILTVTSQLRAKGLIVTDMTLPPSAAQLDVRIKDLPYYVKFNLQGRDARRQAGTFLATKSQLDRSKVTPAQYIDVRVEGRAYYQ